MKEHLIHLTMKQRRVLMELAPQYSETWHALNHAVRPRFWISAGSSSEYIVVCNDAVADVLLRLAEVHCVEAIPAIDVTLGNPPPREGEMSFGTVSEA